VVELPVPDETIWLLKKTSYGEVFLLFFPKDGHYCVLYHLVRGIRLCIRCRREAQGLCEPFHLCPYAPILNGTSQPFDVTTISAPDGSITAKFISLGSTLTELWVKDKNGKLQDVVLGYDDNVRTFVCKFCLLICTKNPAASIPG
jgi:hypothetical protein